MQKEVQLQQKLQSTETLSVFALVSLIAFFVFQKTWLVPLAFGFLAVGLFIKPLARPMSSAWMRFGMALGHFNSKILMGLVFYVFLVPLAWAYRLTHGDFLGLERAEPGDSYWTEETKTYTAADLEKMY